MVKFESLSILGCGNMGGALARGVANIGKWRTENLHVFDSSKEVLNALLSDCPCTGADSPAALVEAADVFICAVKPQVFPALADEIAGAASGPKIFISIMAGLSTGKIQSLLGPRFRIVRTMPNLPLSVSQGATAIATDGHDETLLRTVEDIFQSVGVTVRVKEDLMDAVTGLSGSGPMYVFEFVDALCRAGEKAGLPPDSAYRLTLQTLKGALELLSAGETPPREWTRKVCSPGGTTLAALDVLNKDAFKALLNRAVAAAVARSRELGAA